VVLQQNADAFWRDEVSSIQLANAPSWKAVWGNMVTDSFPILWITILRAWKFLGMGAGDWWLRSLGLVLSAGVFASMFAVARRLRTGPPVLAIALLGGVPAMFYWGDSLRAYALACVLIGLLFGWVWSYAERGGRGVALVCVVIAVLAAQSNYQNSYLIFGICIAGATVSALNRRWGRAVVILGVGASAAASLLPYLGIVTTYQSGASIQKATQITLGLIWKQFTDGFEGVMWSVLPAILLLTALVLFAPIWALVKRPRKGAEMDRFIYPATAVLVSGLSCFEFIKIQGFPTNCWYYLPILTVAVLGIEMTVASCGNDQKIRSARLMVAVIIFIASLPALWSQANLRRTSIDLAAFQIASQAEERDFVMIHPFFESISFSYYYKGRAPWSLLPAVPDDQRLDWSNAIAFLLKADDPLSATFARITQALKSGGRVWIVNGVPLIAPGAEQPDWKKVSHPATGSQGLALSHVFWPMEIGSFLQKHSMTGAAQAVNAGLPVCHFENVQTIFVFKGWKD
jgi:hypothetical protein